MDPHFEDVLARETAALNRVADREALAHWRRSLVEQLVTPQSPYALALQPASDACGQAAFLDRWRELIAETVARVMRCSAASRTACTSGQAPDVENDARRTAVLIVAALHGGSMLSRLTDDPRCLNSALDLAFAPLAAQGDSPKGWETASR